MIRACAAAAFAFALASLSVPAPAAVTLKQTDTFQGGTTLGWSDGPFNPAPAFVAATGGPGGSGDRYLVLASDGGGGSGGKLVGIAPSSWAGNFLAAGVTSIAMDVNNLGVSDLQLRLLFEGTSGRVVSTDGILLPSGSGWRHVSFSIVPAALTALGAEAPASVLGDVFRMRVFHAGSATFPGVDIAASLGLDNVSAVPEPASWLLLGAGLVVTLGGAAARRRRARRA